MKVFYQRDFCFPKKRLLWGGFGVLLAILLCLFSACDMMGGSITEFIEHNTGAARLGFKDVS
jgi:hypothetical protein